MKKKAKIDAAAEPLDAVLNVRFTAREKAAILAQADRAQMTASALARRRLTGAKVAFRPPLAAMEHLRRACALACALAAKSGGDGGGEIAAILAAQRAAMDALGAAAVASREMADAPWEVAG